MRENLHTHPWEMWENLQLPPSPPWVWKMWEITTLLRQRLFLRFLLTFRYHNSVIFFKSTNEPFKYCERHDWHPLVTMSHSTEMWGGAVYKWRHSLWGYGVSDGQDRFLPHHDWTWITGLGRCLAEMWPPWQIWKEALKRPKFVWFRLWMVPYMDKEEKGSKRYSLIAKMPKIFNKNNFPKLQQICTLIAR